MSAPGQPHPPTLVTHVCLLHPWLCFCFASGTEVEPRPCGPRTGSGLWKGFSSWLPVSSLSHPRASGSSAEERYHALPREPGGLGVPSCVTKSNTDPPNTDKRTPVCTPTCAPLKSSSALCTQPAPCGGKEGLLCHGHCFHQDLPITWDLRRGFFFSVFQNYFLIFMQFLKVTLHLRWLENTPIFPPLSVSYTQ